MIRVLRRGASIADPIILLLTTDAHSYHTAYMLLGIGAGFLIPVKMADASLAIGYDARDVAAGLISASRGIL